MCGPSPKSRAPSRPIAFSKWRRNSSTAVLDQVQEAGLDVISLDQAVQRLKEGDDRRFVCFTFDDGYRDNLEYAYPLFKRRNLPLTLYVPTDYPDGTGELWWLALEEIVARADEIELCRNGALWRLPTATAAEKTRAYEEIYWWLRLIDEATQRRVVRVLADRYDIDMAADCAKYVMDWDEIRTMAADPLVTIGAHTKGHFAISKLSAARARDEMVGGADRIEQELGRGRSTSPFLMAIRAAPARATSRSPQCGFKTAVTTRKGMLFPAQAPSHGAAARVAERRLPVADLYRALSLGRAVRAVEPLPRGQRRVTVSSIGRCIQRMRSSRRDHPGKTRRQEEGELHPMRRQRDAACADHRRSRRVERRGRAGSTIVPISLRLRRGHRPHTGAAA